MTLREGVLIVSRTVHRLESASKDDLHSVCRHRVRSGEGDLALREERGRWYEAGGSSVVR